MHTKNTDHTYTPTTMSSDKCQLTQVSDLAPKPNYAMPSHLAGGPVNDSTRICVQDNGRLSCNTLDATTYNPQYWNQSNYRQMYCSAGPSYAGNVYCYETQDQCMKGK